jgi:hypothetical protein
VSARKGRSWARSLARRSLTASRRTRRPLAAAVARSRALALSSIFSSSAAVQLPAASGMHWLLAASLNASTAWSTCVCSDAARLVADDVATRRGNSVSAPIILRRTASV